MSCPGPRVQAALTTNSISDPSTTSTLFSFDTITCLSNLSRELWNRKLKINKIYFKNKNIGKYDKSQVKACSLCRQDHFALNVGKFRHCWPAKVDKLSHYIKRAIIHVWPIWQNFKSFASLKVHLVSGEILKQCCQKYFCIGQMLIVVHGKILNKLIYLSGHSIGNHQINLKPIRPAWRTNTLNATNFVKWPTTASFCKSSFFSST